MISISKTSFLKTIFFVSAIVIIQNADAQKLGAVKEKYTYVGVPTSDFNEVATFGKQRSMNWCWAACIQMILNYYNIPVSQEQIVKRTLGKLADKPADPNMMFKALNGWEVDIYGNKILVNSNFYSTSTKEITAFLLKEKPLIVGLTQSGTNIGHAYVLIGMYYQSVKDNKGETNYFPHSVLLIDPFPGNPNITDMSWSDFTSRLMVSYKVWTN